MAEGCKEFDSSAGATGGMIESDKNTGVPSEKDVAKLSFKVTMCWQSLGILLSVDPDVVDSIKTNNVEFPSPQQKAHAMLRMWLNQGSSSTYESLAEALESVERHDLVEQFCFGQGNANSDQEAQGTSNLLTTTELDAGLPSASQVPIYQLPGNKASSRNQLPQPLQDQVTQLELILKEEYKTRESTYVTPFPWLEDWQLALDGIYIKVRLVERDTQRFGTLKDNEGGMFDIFEPHEHCENPRIVLIEGAPGIGKTVFCQKLASDWSKGRVGGSFPNFRILLNLKCRDILSTSGDLDAQALEDSIADQLLPRDAPEELKKALFEYMKTAQCGVLLVLDGLDECKRAVNLDFLKKHLRFRNCKILLTSRNDPKLRNYCDSLYQIVGFSNEDAVAYITKFFGDDGKEMASSLIATIRNGAHLGDLVSNPLTTSLVSFVFNETGGELPSSKAKLYQELTHCVLQRKYERNGQEPPPDTLATHAQELAILGRLALKGIEKGQLHFDIDEFNAEGRETDMLDFGFLCREKSVSKRINSPCCFQFVHKTLQEHFGAVHLCTQLLSANPDECLSSLGQKTENELRCHYEHVLRFLVCLLSEKGEQGKLVCARLLSLLAQREVDDGIYGGLICDLVHECASVNAEFGEAMIQPVVSSWAVRALDLADRQMSEVDPRFRVACSLVTAGRPLEGLDLFRNQLSDLAALANAVKTSNSLRELLLNGNPLTSDSWGALAAALTPNTTLKLLGLEKKFRDVPAIKNLQEQNPGLRIVFLKR